MKKNWRYKAVKNSPVPKHVHDTMFIKGNIYVIKELNAGAKDRENWLLVEGYFGNSLGGRCLKDQAIHKTVCKEFLTLV